MDLREYINALRKRWYLVALFVVIGGLLGFYKADSTPPSYRATSKVFVSLERGATAQELVQGSTYTQNLVQSYAALASLPVVLDPVIDQLQLPTTAKALGRTITANTPLNTVLIEISANAGTAQRAADVSNAVATQLSTTITDLSPKAQDGDAVRVQVVAPAPVPGFPIAPRTRLLVLTGLLAGLVAGVALALLRQLLDTRVRSPEDIAQLTDAALLGTIPLIRSRRAGAVTAITPSSLASEAYRRLQTNLQFLDASAQLKSIVVTSSLGSEGKSTTAINLALAVAEKGLRVLLVDADMRRPAIAGYCGIEGSAGLTTVLIGRADLEDVIQPWGHPSLHVLALGELPPNPSQLIGSAPMEGLLKRVQDSYDLVVLDSPPLLPVADGAILSRMSDGALVVVNCQKVRRQELVAALDTLDAVDARCLGLVANLVRNRSEQRYYGRLPSSASTRLVERLRRRARSARGRGALIRRAPAAPPAGDGPTA